MPYRAVLLLIPFLMLAEEPKGPSVPKRVDQALRGRVREFMQYQVDGNYRKALDLVAKDTQNYYFTATKMKTYSFKIDSIEYSDKLTKASVISSVRKMRPSAIPVEITVSQTDTWKIESGKWVWYYEERANPLLELTGQALPKDGSPAAVAAAVSQITAATSVSKQSVTFTLGKAGSEEVVFHNGNRGQVKLVSDVIGNAMEFQLDPQSVFVGPNEDATVKINYAPDQGYQISTKVRLTVEPFRQEILISVNLVLEATAPENP